MASGQSPCAIMNDVEAKAQNGRRMAAARLGAPKNPAIALETEGALGIRPFLHYTPQLGRAFRTIPHAGVNEGVVVSTIKL